ncbi:hypothetical protein GGS23DRAFT_576801 [Durotheca rogersii]|uniref:uncharacterized protein n=1 Tax=Durotheca rogersii TaxID=419775 RepID=UPI00221F2554|nr:uncharacterized protein GGS23DRAFT_576801 [Durotheca rogersii]KAI5861436.1 hypothetical protein GGS23DRAFT_576801 [Durotheca rogersii]
MAEVIPGQPVPGVTPLGVPYHSFLGAIWGGVAMSGLALACRLYSRFKGPRRLFWDDAFAIAAFVLVLITGALWQWEAREMYYVIDVQAGLANFEPDFFDRLKRWLVVSLVVELFFYTALILIKFAFLFFFWRLGSDINYFRHVWWPVAFLSLASYLGSVGDVNYKCLLGPEETIMGQCTTLEEIDWTDMTLKVNCALDVLTDFLIMLLPAILLWNVRIRWTKKLAILCLFSLSIVTITIAIVRVASIGLTKRPDGNDDVSYLWLWSAIEPPVAIIVSCFSAFPQLFAQSTRNMKPAFTPSETYLRMMSRIRSGKKHQADQWIDLTAVSQSVDFNQSRLGPSSAETSVQQSVDSWQPILVPNESRLIAHAYTGPHQNAVRNPEGQIEHQVEFVVTTQKG